MPWKKKPKLFKMNMKPEWPALVLLVPTLLLALACNASSSQPDAFPAFDAAEVSGRIPSGTTELPGELSHQDGSLDGLTDSMQHDRETDFAPAWELKSDLASASGVRIPAEWEPQEATWMQWPTNWEASLRSDFARAISVVQKYQSVHLLVLDKQLEKNAREKIADVGGDPDDVVYHEIQYDSSWMRDNGPVYSYRDATPGLRVGAALEVQDWGFDAWGGNFGRDIPFAADDLVPAALATLLDVDRIDYGDYILERGNLESNGAGTILLGWDCQLDRNPGWSQEATQALLEDRLGAQQILWVYGHDPEDFTTGHIDGVARFVDETTVVVARSLVPGDPTAEAMEEAAELLEGAGFDVVRLDIPGTVLYKGSALPAIYMNWLVGNGFVAATAFGKPDWDMAAEETLKGLFPGRTVHMVDTLELWYNGGGLHCITNDQPAGVGPAEPDEP